MATGCTRDDRGIPCTVYVATVVKVMKLVFEPHTPPIPTFIAMHHSLYHLAVSLISDFVYVSLKHLQTSG